MFLCSGCAIVANCFAVSVDCAGFRGWKLTDPFSKGFCHAFQDVAWPLYSLFVLKRIHEGFCSEKVGIDEAREEKSSEEGGGLWAWSAGKGVGHRAVAELIYEISGMRIVLDGKEVITLSETIEEGGLISLEVG